jgi:hypothetical protein
MPETGSCQTCPRAIGVLVTPTGLTHACAPEEWRVCNVLSRAGKNATATGQEMRTGRATSPLALLRRRWLAKLFLVPWLPTTKG